MNCTLWSAAYLLGISTSALAAEIGHDGEEIMWPEYTDCRCKRGFSLPEIQDCFYKRGLMLAPIFLSPMIAPGTDAKAVHLWPQERCEQRFHAFINNRRAIIMGRVGEIGHAIVFDMDHYVDPRTGKAEDTLPTDFSVQEAYLICCL